MSVAARAIFDRELHAALGVENVEHERGGLLTVGGCLLLEIEVSVGDRGTVNVEMG